MGGLVRGLAAFSGGFGEGYFSGKEKERQHQIENERLAMERRRADLEAQRLGLENDKLRQDEEMRRKLTAANEDVKPQEAFIVQNPNGQMVYTDQKLAQQHADNDPTAQVVQAYVVNGQTFSDKEHADQAAQGMNAPAVKMRKKAEIYSSYGREDLAGAAMTNYRAMLDNNRREMQQEFLVAQQTGNVKAVIDAYNQALPNGVKAELVAGQNGGAAIQLSRGGQPLGQPQPFDWDTMAKAVMRTPDNMAELWYRDKSLGVQEKQVNAQVRHLDAQTADIPEAAKDRRTSAGAAATSAGAAAANATTARGELGLKIGEKVYGPAFSGVDSKTGDIVQHGAGFTLDAKGNPVPVAPGLRPRQTFKGVQPVGAYTAGIKNPMNMFGGLGAPGGFNLTPDNADALVRALSAANASRQPAPGTGASAAPPGQLGSGTYLLDPNNPYGQ